MSSHHIVRENQEPALFIGDPHLLADDYVNQLLEWSPTIITLSFHYETLKSRGIKIDVLLNSEELIREELEENLVVIPYWEDYLAVLFQYLKERKNYAVNLIMDQIGCKDLLPYLPDFTVNVFNGSYKLIFIKQYDKWLPEGYQLWIPDSESLRISNVRWITESLFEVESDGFVKIAPLSDYIMLGEQL